MSLTEVVTQGCLSAAEIQGRTTRIRDAILKSSPAMDGPNFRAIKTSDLRHLFQLYDAEFFRGHLRRVVGDRPLSFRLSRRLTTAAGTMTHRTRRDFPRQRLIRLPAADRLEFEITISATILFQSFTEPGVTTKATGLVCHNRLDALQRVFEHELIHLAETLVWSNSRCAGRRFQSIARRLFGHREHTHNLVTSRDHAQSKFGLRIGDWVAFELEGQRHIGQINRITRRATVLVQDPRGMRYTDGRHYRKFYVPLEMLTRADQANAAASNKRTA